MQKQLISFLDNSFHKHSFSLSEDILLKNFLFLSLFSLDDIYLTKIYNKIKFSSFNILECVVMNELFVYSLPKHDYSLLYVDVDRSQMNHEMLNLLMHIKSEKELI